MKYTTDNTGTEIRLSDLCYFIYQGFGQDTVIKFCESIDWQSWYFCNDCEYESPCSDEPDSWATCLVCGSTDLAGAPVPIGDNNA